MRGPFSPSSSFHFSRTLLFFLSCTTYWLQSLLGFDVCIEALGFDIEALGFDIEALGFDLVLIQILGQKKNFSNNFFHTSAWRPLSRLLAKVAASLVPAGHTSVRLHLFSVLPFFVPSLSSGPDQRRRPLCHSLQAGKLATRQLHIVHVASH